MAGLATQPQAAINQAISRGTTVVVAAVGHNGGRASYSNFGNLVDVAAPGGYQSTGTSDGVLSTLNSGSGAPASAV